MLHRILLLVSIALPALLATSSQAQAWGGAHVGYTHVGPGGVYHAGATAGYGGAGGYRYGAGGYGGYRYGGGGYGYGGGYRYGGYEYGGYGGARAGYYRRW